MLQRELKDEHDKIIGLKYLIRIKGRYDCYLPTSCRMEERGHLWYSTGKEKVPFQQREDNAGHLMLCQQLALNKFKMEILKKRSKPSEATSGTTSQLQELRGSCSFFQDGDTLRFKKSTEECWLVCFPVPNFFRYTCCPSLFFSCYLPLNFQEEWAAHLPFFMLTENPWPL